MRDAAARILGLRASDFDHLVRAGLLTHAATARSGWNKQHVVLLYRQADLDRLARSRRLDGPAIHATPRAIGPHSLRSPHGWRQHGDLARALCS
ncbi:hypothetical protein [Streptomyces sp. AcE210]|uniref:hypothetical protein n=1 Tax=Streptomyces sp. AcE210 TaxID=2292703 RepID=UPI001F0BF436|nr:hypothetical protein [Streptomyces sp. AcE210]